DAPGPLQKHRPRDATLARGIVGWVGITRARRSSGSGSSGGNSASCWIASDQSLGGGHFASFRSRSRSWIRRFCSSNDLFASSSFRRSRASRIDRTASNAFFGFVLVIDRGSAVEVGEQRHEVLGVLLLHRQDSLQHPARGG